MTVYYLNFKCLTITIWPFQLFAGSTQDFHLKLRAVHHIYDLFICVFLSCLLWWTLNWKRHNWTLKACKKYWDTYKGFCALFLWAVFVSYWCSSNKNLNLREVLYLVLHFILWQMWENRMCYIANNYFSSPVYFYISWNNMCYSYVKMYPNIITVSKSCCFFAIIHSEAQHSA